MIGAARLRRGTRVTAFAFVLGVACLNALAYHHARAMTHFAPAGERTPRPQELSATDRLRVLLTGAVIPRPRNRLTPKDVGLEFETRTFPATDGLRLEGWLVSAEHSRGLVLLFHGYADKKDSMLPQARALRELGYAALLVDFRGSGGSEGNETSIGFHEAKDVAGAMAYARSLDVPGPRLVLGTSMGAAAILTAAGREGLAPDAAILESPFDRLLTTVTRRFEAMRAPAFPAAQLLVFWGGQQVGFDGFAHDPVAHAPKLRCPTLLLHGGADAYVSLEDLRRIERALGGAHELHVFPGVAHQCLASAQPEAWRAVVRRFLDTLPSGGDRSR